MGLNQKELLNTYKENIIIYKKNKFKATDKLYTNNQKDLLKCNIIFILSPNNTHYYFLEKFNKNKYIFCEKPPVNKYKELLKLSKKILIEYILILIIDILKINEALKKQNTISLEKFYTETLVLGMD